VLSPAKDGMFLLDMLVLPMVMITIGLWVPKTLVTNMK
jgi:hypothetical protein